MIVADVKTLLFKSLETKEWVEVGYPTNSDEVDFDPSIGIKLKYTQTLSLIHKLRHTHTHKEMFAEEVIILKSHEKKPKRLQKSARQSKPKQISKQEILPMNNKTLKKTQKLRTQKIQNRTQPIITNHMTPSKNPA